MKLYPGRIYDVLTTNVRHGRGGKSIDHRINDVLARHGFWRLGRANGNLAFFRVASPYKRITLWPSRRRW